MAVTADDIIREARALIGTPWVHQGRTPLGVDCIGFVWLVALRAGVDLRGLGVSLPRRYGRVADAKLYSETDRLCQRSDPRPGCLVLFRFPEDRYPRHFGLLTRDETVIHAEAKTRMMVIEHGYRAHWVSRSQGAWAIPGVTYE